MTTEVLNHTQQVKAVGRTQHLSRRALKRVKKKEQGERGYVLVMTCIMLPVLILFIAMATDITYYYARSVQLQRIADTAALGGVTYMPREAEARKAATEIAKRNGSQNSIAGVEVTAEAPPESTRRLRVVVRDRQVPLFFGRIFKEYWDISKNATAEYVSNIPLGSKLNVIGNGNLTGTPGSEMSPQNFWLAVSGPCTPKESGDRIASRYDGNSINTTTSPGTNVVSGQQFNKHARLCDWDTANKSATPEQRLEFMKAERLKFESASATTDIFDGVSINLDYDPEGYNYIVDVPCLTLGKNGDPLPPPCIGDPGIPDALKIDVFDPVFNPDSVQRFLKTGSKQIKPDGYGVLRRSLPAGVVCHSGNLSGCNAFPEASAAPPTALTPIAAQLGINPEEVTVATDFRVYGPDDTPTYYRDDVTNLLSIEASNPNRKTTAAFVDPTESGKVQRFGTCINMTDNWMKYQAGDLIAIDDANGDYVPDDPTGDVTVLAASNASDPSYEPTCAITPTTPGTGQYASKTVWRNLITIPAGSPRGRYRINVRTVSSSASFGSNAFSLRAWFGTTFKDCGLVACSQPIPSVSGDTSMSVFASIPNDISFYLAKLSPAPLFRDKTVVLSLWDIGEGGDTVQVLRPTNDVSDCPNGSLDGACIQKMDWKIGSPGINALADGLNPTVVELADSCQDFGKKDQLELSITGNWDQYAVAPNTCDPVPNPLLISREGYAGKVHSEQYVSPLGPCTANAIGRPVCPSGLFNDRSVSVSFKVPSDYGCEPGTATPTSPCIEDDDLADGGWWKIRYKPAVKPWDGQKVTMTDRTTWTVQLVGDPVRLVLD